jgi:hypothetical protein
MYDKYIGIPYKENGRTDDGLDCWGLVRLFYKQEFNIDLPSYEDEYVGSYDPKVPQTINYYKDSWSKTMSPKLGDICLFNILGEPTHVGIYFENNKFLHARDGHSTVIESLLRPAWKNRLEGIYSYAPKSSIIQLTGSPHPFKTHRILDYAAAGLTVKQCVDYICEKYKVSEKLFKQIIVAVDGIAVPNDRWQSTILSAGQTVTYKTIPQGRNGLRTLLFIAVVIFATEYAPEAAKAIFGAEVGASSFAIAATKVAISAAGIALVNALVPIRPPKLENADTGRQLNLFNGASNRANQYGAIPVVLGRVRMTPPLGSVPYVDTQTTTSYMNLQLVWGFGPLNVDMNEMYIGANKLDYYYQSNNADAIPKPVTIAGYVNTSGTESETDKITEFNKLYPNIVEQQFKNVELENDASSNNEETVTFVETQATRVQAIVSFPEGLRKISTKDGKSSSSEVTIQAVLEKVSGSGATIINNWTSSVVFEDTLTGQSVTEYDVDGQGTTYKLYQKTAYCITEKNGIKAIRGSVSTTKGNPSSTIIELLKRNQLSELLNIQNNYSFEPVIPDGHKVIRTVINYSTDPLDTTDLITNTYIYNGWLFTATAVQDMAYDSSGLALGPTDTGRWKITIGPGSLGSLKSGVTSELAPTASGGLPSRITVWTSRQFTNVINTTNNGAWGPTTGNDQSFMNAFAVWKGTTNTFDEQMVVNFPYEGTYTIQASIDNYAGQIIIGDTVINIPDNCYRAKTTLASGSADYTTTEFFSAGNKVVRVKASNNADEQTVTTAGSSNCGVAVRILFIPDNIVNFVPGANYITLGDNEFSNYKDGFNYPITWDNLEPGQYRVKLRRTSTSDPDHQTDYRHNFRSQFLSAAAFKTGTTIAPPPGIGICRTGIVIESSGKVNGSVDGINALVQTKGLDYTTIPGSTSKGWVADQLIDNPASLFVYVLTHPANAYRVDPSDPWKYIDSTAITEWHQYCDTPVAGVRPRLTYNGVVTDTTSILSILQDICAAGMASPVFIDGKWSVVIDKVRPHVIQHFTPHNSWGFEATKNLPKLPDAFRISFPDERNSFQTTEVLVANFNKTVNTAKVIEELQLPGITKIEQVRYFARWHFAQLQYRPEVFTINTDFEYLVSTRGDRVKVTHDIPLWGNGSGRIREISTNKLVLTLTEDIILEAGKSYQIRIRTDNISATIGSGSIERTLTAIPTTASYNSITLASAVDSTVKVGDLFMLGEVNKVSQDLLIQSIETTSNTSAKLTLVEYTESLYNFSFDPFNDATPSMPSYTPIITKRIASEAVQNTIVGTPKIISMSSDSSLSEEIATGSYQNVTIVTWENAANLPVIAEQVEFQIVLGNESFTDTKQVGVYTTRKDAVSITIKGLETDKVYKVRARYKNGPGSIAGPWSDEFGSTITGKTTNSFTPNDVMITLQGTNIIVKPILSTGNSEPSDHKTYEFRLYRNTGTGDFWTATWDSTNMLKAQSRTQAVFNLLDLPSTNGNRRISQTGINYRVACRALSNTNSYSSTSVLGSILIKTIQ